jgi:hypothetical protein
MLVARREIEDKDVLFKADQLQLYAWMERRFKNETVQEKCWF